MNEEDKKETAAKENCEMKDDILTEVNGGDVHVSRPLHRYPPTPYDPMIEFEQTPQ